MGLLDEITALERKLEKDADNLSKSAKSEIKLQIKRLKKKHQKRELEAKIQAECYQVIQNPKRTATAQLHSFSDHLGTQIKNNGDILNDAFIGETGLTARNELLKIKTFNDEIFVPCDQEFISTIRLSWKSIL